MTWQWLEDPATARAALALAAVLHGPSCDDVESHAIAFVATAVSAAATTGDAPPWLAEVKRTLDSP